MNDRVVTAALSYAQNLERELRAVVQAEDLAERDAALNVLRLTIPLKRSLETWLALRALRAQLQMTQSVK